LDQKYLMNFVRRVLKRRLDNDQPYQAVYVPPTLSELQCSVAVTLRRKGLLVGTGDSEILPVMEACRQAVDKTLLYARQKKSTVLKDLEGMSLEIELFGPRQQVGNCSEETEILLQHFEPAVHGIAFSVKGKEVFVKPSQLISIESFCKNDWRLDHRCNRYYVAIENFKEKAGLYKDPPARKPASLVVCRFRTMHLYQPQPGFGPVHLMAGLRIVLPGEVTRSLLVETVDDLARFIRYRQNSDGFFSYEFLPGRDIYWPKDMNWVRQAGTTWGLGIHARRFNNPESGKAFARAIEAFAKIVKPLPGRDDASYVHTPDGRHTLGTSALLCLALMDGPQPDKYLDLRISLLNGLATMQRPDGSFKTHFLPAMLTSSQNYYPGEALLAIARHYALVREAKWRKICDKALPYYLQYFRKEHPPMFVPWQVQAFGALARTTMLQKYADFVYEMSDYLAPMQIEDHPELPIYIGGIDVYGMGRTGISTGVYAEGFVDAARTAQKMGDRKRAARYSELVAKAARFIVQLRFRPEEAYYVQSPQDVIGAVRNTPINPTLRIDHVQHALAALMGTVELMGQNTQPGNK
ncbi:MAG: hypothetical protein ACYTBZ_26970, partial [Planctomycetota bacterium]